MNITTRYTLDEDEIKAAIRERFNRGQPPFPCSDDTKVQLNAIQVGSGVEFTATIEIPHEDTAS